MAELEQYLQKQYIENGFTFGCNGWRNLFSIQELVFHELFVEFFATINFEEWTSDPTYNGALAFRLGGDYKEYSLLEFAWCMGLYPEDETRSPNFILFLQDCV